MKARILFSTLLVLFVTITFAHDKKKPSAIAIREIQTFQTVKKMIIGNNVKVILVADNDYPFLTLTGDASLLQSVNVSTKGEELEITSFKNLKDKKILFHVPVKDLAYMELKTGSELSVQGYIPCSNLLVVVNADAHLALKYKGKATIKAADECEVVYEKQEILL